MCSCHILECQELKSLDSPVSLSINNHNVFYDKVANRDKIPFFFFTDPTPTAHLNEIMHFIIICGIYCERDNIILCCCFDVGLPHMASDNNTSFIN